MTGQRHDEVQFEGAWFDITAVDGTGLFDPAAHGIEPRWLSTGCWRGHVCRYTVVER